MDILKRSISPVSAAAWEEIDEQAVKVLKSRLSGRKFVDVAGPFGWAHASVPTGRLDVSKAEGKSEVRWGVHLVQPLVESRVSFEMGVWELDNVARGAKDLDHDPLIEDAEKMASFEENAIYHGFEPGCIVGLDQSGEGQQISVSTENPREIMAGLSEGLAFFQKNSIEGPYTLVAGPRLWQILDVFGEGYPLKKRVSSMFDGGIFRRHTEGIPPYGMEYVVSLHLFVSCHHIAYGVVSHMPHMNLAGGIGKHLQEIVFLPFSIFAHLECLFIIPAFLPFFLYFPGIVLSIHYDFS